MPRSFQLAFEVTVFFFQRGLVPADWKGSGRQSPQASVPENLLIPTEIDSTPAFHEDGAHVQRRPGPFQPQRKIPQSEWSNVLRHLDQGESLRQMAGHYGVSYKAVRKSEPLGLF
ncbi:MAG: hypothetical protein NVSMB38_38530 [Ktedonobacteraceae bacterium]